MQIHHTADPDFRPRQNRVSNEDHTQVFLCHVLPIDMMLVRWRAFRSTSSIRLLSSLTFTTKEPEIHAGAGNISKPF